MPEDRLDDGVITEFTVAENMILDPYYLGRSPTVCGSTAT